MAKSEIPDSDGFGEGAAHDELRSAAEVLQKADTGRSFVEILSAQMVESFALYQLSRSTVALSAFLAGLEIGFSYLVCGAAFATLVPILGAERAFHSFALFYPLGFVLVVLGRSVLFTEQTALLTLPVLNGTQKTRALLEMWGVVIGGNLAGGCAFGLLTWAFAPRLGLFTHADMAHLAEHVLGVGWGDLFVSATLAGWLMGLLSWVLASATDTTSRILLVSLITGTIGFLGLHHSIVGNIEVFVGLLTSAHVGVFDYLAFLGIALLGNASGGALIVALSKYKAFTSNYA